MAVKPPNISGRELNHKEKSDVINKLIIKYDEILNIRVLSHTSLRRKEDGDRFRQVFVLEKPASARIDFMPFNAALAFGILLINGEQVIFLDSNNKVARITDSIRKATKSILRMPIGYSDLMSLITARIPLRYLKSEDGKVRILYDDIASMFHLIVGDYDYYAAVSSETYLVEKFEIRDEFNGKPLLNGEYLSFNQDKLLLPSNLSARLVQDDAEINMQFSTIKANSEIKPSVFSLEIPSDYNVTDQW